jgi:hypothetical protein
MNPQTKIIDIIIELLVLLAMAIVMAYTIYQLIN